MLCEQFVTSSEPANVSGWAHRSERAQQGVSPAANQQRACWAQRELTVLRQQDTEWRVCVLSCLIVEQLDVAAG